MTDAGAVRSRGGEVDAPVHWRFIGALTLGLILVDLLCLATVSTIASGMSSGIDVTYVVYGFVKQRRSPTRRRPMVENEYPQIVVFRFSLALPRGDRAAGPSWCSRDRGHLHIRLKVTGYVMKLAPVAGILRDGLQRKISTNGLVPCGESMPSSWAGVLISAWPGWDFVRLRSGSSSLARA